MTILLDTGPLAALCDPRDDKHRMSVKHLTAFGSGEFAVCDAALTETCFHLPFRNERQRLRVAKWSLPVFVKRRPGGLGHWRYAGA